MQPNKDKIIIVDFGSQVTKLIARRVREHGIFSEILTITQLAKFKEYNLVKGIILSGGPSTVTKKKFLKIPRDVFKKKIPILGICYGLQLISKIFGGKVSGSLKKREFGRVLLKKKRNSKLTKKFFINNKTYVWMSHQDAVIKLPKNFVKIASTTNSEFTIIEN